MRFPPRLVTSVELILAVVLAAAVLGWHYQIGANLLRHQEMLLPGEASATATSGYRIFPDPDVYTWLTYAKESIVTGQWRINHTQSDNPPYGRGAHWNSLLVWLMVAAGWIRAWWTGEPIFTALENAAFWVNAFLFFCTAGLFYAVMRRFVGVVATWTGLLLLATMIPMSWTFHPGRPDHQTLYFLAGLGTMCCLLRGGLGWVREDGSGGGGLLALPEAGQARRWFAASAIFGAAGIWFGASVQITVLVFAGLTVLGLVYFTPREDFEQERAEGIRYRAELWTQWGLVGAGATVFFYLLQYFPDAMEMRLEAVHPLHAVSWLGAGWVMTYLCRWHLQSGYRLWSQPGFYLAIALLAAWPLASQLGPEAWHALRDPVVARFQTRTTEGMPLPMAHGKEWMKIFFAETGGMLLLLFIAPLLAALSKITRPQWTMLFFLWCSSAGYLIMTYWQSRWLMHWTLTSILLGCLCLPLLAKLLAGRAKYAASGGVLVVMLGTVGWSGWRLVSDLQLQTKRNALLPMFIDGLVIKRLAKEIRARHPDEEVRMILEPTSAPAIYYFAGIKSVGSLFWQNAQGLRDHRDFLVDTDTERLRPLEIVRERDLQYVMVWESPVSTTFPLYLKYGERLKEAEGEFFVNKLVDGGPILPEWLEPDYQLMFSAGGSFPFPLPQGVPQMRIYKVQRAK
jgi:hypothetical protein